MLRYQAVVVHYKNDDITDAMTEFASSVDVVLIGPGLKKIRQVGSS